MSIKVSIIVPVYKTEKYLNQCVDSILGQTYQNIEIILVDDGSPDECPAICDEYAAKDDRVRVIHTENRGLSKTREAGVKAATGDYITFVDSDDWIDRNTIGSCVLKIESDNRLECVLFSFTREKKSGSQAVHLFDGSVRFDSTNAYDRVYKRLFGLENHELSNPLTLENLDTCWGKLYRKDIIRKGVYVDTSVVGSCEDGIFNMYALYGCNELLYIDIPFYHYRKSDNTLTSSFKPKMICKYGRLFRLMEKIIEEKDLDEKCSQALNNRIVLSITAIGLNELSNPDHGIMQNIIGIKKYLGWQKFHRACMNMRIGKMPLPWKVLVICCRARLSVFVYIILKTMEIMKKR